jgi:LPXTG-motif cell wall-anchored protein
MNKDKNTELLGADGKPILASAKFTAAEGGKGTVDVIFTFDGNILKGHDIDIVAFEECIPADGTVPVGTHSDINDKGQTVTVRNTPKTGDDASILLYMGLSVISLIAIVILMNRRRRRTS